jgi:hypothetical protein
MPKHGGQRSTQILYVLESGVNVANVFVRFAKRDQLVASVSVIAIDRSKGYTLNAKRTIALSSGNESEKLNSTIEHGNTPKERKG